MPSVIGKVGEKELEFIEEELVENGQFDSKSEAVEHLINYGLNRKYGYDR